MASFDFDYAIQMLRQAIDFAEVERDFVPLRKWASEVEKAGHELDAIECRLNLPAGRDVLQSVMQAAAARTISPEEALHRIRRWLNDGQLQKAETVPISEFQLA